MPITFLITHPASKFETDQLVGNVTEALRARGIEQITKIQDNAYQREQVRFLDLVGSELLLPLITLRWRFQLNKKARYLFVHSLVALLQVLHGLFNLIASGLSMKKMLQLRNKNLRILNISAAHLSAWRQGVKSHQDYICVLEDDGIFHDVLGLSRVVDWIYREVNPSEYALVDVSNSYSFEELGVSQAGVNTVFNLVEHGQRVVQTQNPITNTCAAVIYSRGLLTLLEKFLTKSLDDKFMRSVPIDWQINRFFMNAPKKFRFKTLHVVPGLIRQGSFDT